jgi:hypothetical protein
MKSCRDVRSELFASFEHALEIEETLAIEEHLRDCAACAEEARRARLVHEAFARLPAAPVGRVDVERNVGAVRAAIDRRPAERPVRPWPWIAAAAAVVVLALAARLWFSSGDVTQPTGTNAEAPRVVEEAGAAAPESRAVVQEAPLAHSTGVPVVADLAPLEPLDTARLEEARAGVREAIVATLPALAANDVAGFVAGVDHATVELARGGWPVARIVERFTEDADPRVADGALRWLGRRGDALAVRRLESALLEPERRDAASAALVDALAKRDSAALVATLARSVKARPRGLDAHFALDLVTRERLAAALPWLEESARERALRGDEALAQASVAAIASFDDVAALRALLRLRETNRMPSHVVEPALLAFLERTPRTAFDLAREPAAPHGADELRALNDALLEAPRVAFVPAWTALAAAKELSRGDRRFVILLAGEHGSIEHVPALVELLRRFDRRERDLKAAVLIALHRIGGDATLEEVLAGTPKEPRARILELFHVPASKFTPETDLLELARRLEPLVAPLQL